MRPMRGGGRFALILAVIVVAAGIIRAAVFAQSHDWIVFTRPVLDAAFYDESARALLSGQWPGADPYFMGPLYTYVVATLYVAFGSDVVVIRIAQMLMGCALVGTVGILGRRLFGTLAGLLAAGFTALYGPLVFIEQLPLMATCVTLLSLLLFERAWAWRDGDGLRAAIPAGLLLGALVAMRGTTIAYLVPIVMMARWRPGSLRLVPVALAGAALVMAPFTLHNLTSGSRALTTTSLGWNLYIGNNASANGMFAYPNGARAETDPTGREFASQQVGRHLTPDETNRYWLDAALRHAREDPLDLARLWLRKLVLTVQNDEIPQNENFRFFIANNSNAQIAVFGFWLALPLALASLVTLRRHRAALNYLFAFAAVPLLTSVVFFATARYRVPAVPFLLLMGGAVVSEWLRPDAVRRRRDVIGAAVTFAVALVMLVAPAPYNRAAATAREYEHLGLRFQNEGQFWTAESNYRKALEIKPDDGDAWNNLGTVLVYMEKYAAAEDAFLRSARAQPDNPVPLVNLAMLHGQNGDHAGAERFLSRAVALDPTDASLLVNLGTAQALQDRLADAIATFERALRLDPTHVTAREMLRSARELQLSLEDAPGEEGGR